MGAPPRKSRATIIDIARLAGVSKSTVSLVLKNSTLVKAETRERVLGAMQALGYVYNRGAANLRLARSNIVGMVISDLMNPFFTELAVSIEEALYRAGYVPLLANTGEDPERQTRVLQSIFEQGVAGIVISPSNRSDVATLLDIARAGLPIVTVTRRLAESGLPYVGQDNTAGERIAVEHLIGLGHRRIGFLGGYATMATQRERVAGYKEALSAHGIVFEPILIAESPPTRSGGGVAVKTMIDLPDPPTAAVCFNDMVAVGAIRELSRQGIRAGRDFSIVGFDDIAEAAHNAPPLTTVTGETRQLGAEAAHVLLDLIAGAPAPAAPVIGPTRLIVRESSGAPAGERTRLRA
ncbi:MAG: LacI family DNA-binding transcriptional regulator [Methylobacteriaceae bacterium]|nr:LacI family DNA-binding transcriptional regulator [Methylobacteriaceae bacterium]